ncbi:MAG: HipA domain-containing protein [Balneolaceae bacterium]
MATEKTDIIVYAHWRGMANPVKMGVLSAQEVRGHLTWSFAYEEEWLNTQSQLELDPDLNWFTGPQYSKDDKPNFGMFLDSMPDTWGRTLMKKREALLKPKGEQARRLTDIDYLLGVYDPARMGGLRFKLDGNGPFLDDDKEKSIPPIADVRELQVGADLVESDEDSEVVRKWLHILLAPGSSLGGARPKSSVLDENGELWIAKFPSRKDSIDKGAWEYVAWILAKSAGITVPETKVEQLTGKDHTFFSKRFDRAGVDRIHFASAMTMAGHFESGIRDRTPSYLELAEFIQFNGASPYEDLHELWRRIVFNIAISNTDDHLRNHGFIITDEGWRLSPAYDMNPSIDKAGLALNIDLELNALDYDLAKSVGEYFNLNKKEMDSIIEEVQDAVLNWEEAATNIGIPSVQRRLMAAAFISQ